MIIECIRCGKTYKNIKIFANHLTKSNKCIETYISIPKKYYKEHCEEINHLFENDYNSIKNDNNGLKYGCEHCGGTYNDKRYYYRHKKNHCKENSQTNIQDSQNIENSQNAIGQNAINANGQNQIMSNNPSITINNYGSTIDVTLLPLDVKKNIISNPLDAISKMCESVYINIPQNRNVYIKDSKEGYGMIYKNGIWEKIPLNSLISEIVENSADYVTDIVEDDTFTKSSRTIEKINKHFNNVINDNKIAQNEKNNVKCILDNKSNVVKEHYEKLINKKVRLNLKPLLCE